MRRTILGILFSLVLATSAVAAHRLTISVEDLTLLAESDLSNQTILVFLDPREIGFELDAETIARLRQLGVSDEVIRYLLERTGGRSERNASVVYVSAGVYPPRYHDFYYGHGAVLYYGATIARYWTHGYHRVGHHLIGGDHLGGYVEHFASHRGRHYASTGLLDGGHRTPSHSSGGHGARSHFGSHGVSHVGAAHSGPGHSGGHGRGGHGGGHGGGAH